MTLLIALIELGARKSDTEATSESERREWGILLQAGKETFGSCVVTGLMCTDQYVDQHTVLSRVKVSLYPRERFQFGEVKSSSGRLTPVTVFLQKSGAFML